MRTEEIPLRLILESPRSQRVRDLDQEFVKALAESFKAGSEQQSPIPAYRTNGTWHAIGGNHQLAAMKLAFGEDSERLVTIRPVSPRLAEDAVLEAAKDNNHRDMTMLEWQGVFELAKARMKTQAAIAMFFGVSESFVSHCLKIDSYGPDAQARRRVKSVVTTDSAPSESPPPQLGEPSRPPTMPESTRIGSGPLPLDGGRESDEHTPKPVGLTEASGTGPAAANPAIHPPSQAPDDAASVIDDSPCHAIQAVQGALSSPRVVPSYEKAVLEATDALGALRALLSPRRYAGATNDATTPLAQEMEAVAWLLLDTAADLRSLRFPAVPTPREHIPVVIRTPDNGNGGTRAVAREVRAKRAVPVVREVS